MNDQRDPYASEPAATQAYDQHQFTQAQLSRSGAEQHTTDELEFTRPLSDLPAERRSYDRGFDRSAEEPTQRLAAPVPEPQREETHREASHRDVATASYASTPAPLPTGYGQEQMQVDRLGLAGESASLVGVLQQTPRGPSGGARAGALIVSLCIAALFGILAWDISRGSEAIIMPGIATVTDDPTATFFGVVGVCALLLFFLGLTVGWSGLGVGVVGLLALVGGAIMVGITAFRDSDSLLSNLSQLGATVGWLSLALLGALLLAVGIGAHFTRRGGFKSAQRIAESFSR